MIGTSSIETDNPSCFDISEKWTLLTELFRSLWRYFALESWIFSSFAAWKIWRHYEQPFNESKFDFQVLPLTKYELCWMNKFNSMNDFVICNLNVFDQYLLFNVSISSKRIGSAVVLLLNWIFGFFRNNKMNFVDEIIPYLNRVFQKKNCIYRVYFVISRKWSDSNSTLLSCCHQNLLMSKNPTALFSVFSFWKSNPWKIKDQQKVANNIPHIRFFRVVFTSAGNVHCKRTIEFLPAIVPFFPITNSNLNHSFVFKQYSTFFEFSISCSGIKM